MRRWIVVEYVGVVEERELCGSSSCRITTHCSSTGRHTPSQLPCIPLNLQSYIPETEYDTLADGPYSVSSPHNQIWCQQHCISILACSTCSGPFQFLVCLVISSVTMELQILGLGLQMVRICVFVVQTACGGSMLSVVQLEGLYQVV